MAILKVIQNNSQKEIYFSGNPLLEDLLAENGYDVSAPCGIGKCGKCKVFVSGDVSPANQKEIEAGCRLACQVVLYGDALVVLSDRESFENIENGTVDIKINPKNQNWKYGIAVDVGTTTVVLKLFSSNGNLLSEASAVNPQRSLSADIIGRIDAALNGKAELLKEQIDNCIDKLTSKVCNIAGIDIDSIDRKIITGNTAMLYFLTKRSPKSIATAPFQSETLFGEWIDKTYLPSCMNAFVGADTTCAVLATEGCLQNESFLLCDIGTNGEIALWKDEKLYVTSAAAGPAFEGAEISCGCGSIKGAIDKVWIENGKIHARTIGNERAIGICGSGLIDAVWVFLELGYIDKTGTVTKPLILTANGGIIELLPEDICAVQLAKAAVCAAIEMVLKYSGTKISDISKFYIAGGFGNHISLENAAKIGLFPKELCNKATVMGNAALSGAIMMLFDDNQIEKSVSIAKVSKHITLGGNEDFNSAYIKNMMF